MIIIIDGYNILKQILPQKHIGERDREKFAHQLSGYAKRKGHEIVLVFDGGMSVRPEQTRIGRVKMVYSGVRDSADDYIKKYLRKFVGHDMLLVSSDNEIALVASHLQIPHIGGVDFYKYIIHSSGQHVFEKKADTSGFKKMTEESSTELDELMMAESKKVQRKDELGVDLRQTISKNKLSKEERKLLQILQKL